MGYKHKNNYFNHSLSSHKNQLDPLSSSFSFLFFFHSLSFLPFTLTLASFSRSRLWLAVDRLWVGGFRSAFLVVKALMGFGFCGFWVLRSYFGFYRLWVAGGSWGGGVGHGGCGLWWVWFCVSCSGYEWWVWWWWWWWWWWFGGWFSCVVRWWFLFSQSGGVSMVEVMDGFWRLCWVFGGKWLLAVVGLLDLVVIAGCVGLMVEERERGKREIWVFLFLFLFILFDGVIYIILMSCI